MSDIFEGFVDWKLDKQYGGAPTVGGQPQEEWLPVATVEPKNVNQPQFTKPTVLQEKVGQGLESLKYDVESKPMESAYGLAKGAVQGTIGSVGDLVSIAKGIYYATQTPEGQSKVEEFIKGMESSTGAPTSEDVAKFLDQYLPAGPKSAEFAGELISLGGIATKAGKEIAKVSKKVSTKTKAKVAVGPAVITSTQASKEKAK